MHAAPPPLLRAETVSAPPVFQRTTGALDLAFARAGRGARPVRLVQEGALKVRLPTVHGDHACQAIVINTAGGLTGGDRLVMRVKLDAGARLTVSGQACEKLYKSAGGEAVLATSLEIGAGASLEWLMQPAILFDQARLARKINVDLAADSSLLAVEAMVFGRTEMKEDVVSGHVADSWRVRRDGVLVYADTFRLDGAIRQALDRPSVLAGNRAQASILYVGADAGARCAEMRDAMVDMQGCVAAASAWNGLLAARVIAADGYALTRGLIDLLTRFRNAKLPRPWMI